MSYKLTPQNRVTMPKSIRNHLKVEWGDRIVLEPLDDGSVRIVAENRQVARGQHFGRTLVSVSSDEAVVTGPAEGGLAQYLLKSPKVDGFELPLRRSRKVPPALGR